MKVIYNNIIPPRGFKYVNLFGLLFGRKKFKDKITATDLNHESIHTAQMIEMLVIPFYLWYFLEWLIKLIIYPFKKEKKGLHSVYRSISFEREAYSNQDNLCYLNKRRHYSWFKLIWKE